MKLIEKEYTIDFEIYPFKIIVILTNDIGKSRNNRLELFNSVGFSSYEGVRALSDCTKDGSIAYMFFYKDELNAGVICHESYHALIHLFNYIGVKKHDNEHVAYLLEYIVYKVHKLLKV